MFDPTRLRPYQAEGVVRFTEAAGRRLILNYGTAAGKTLTAIACTQAVNAKRVLVVCPAKARPTWLREFKKWANIDAAAILYGRTRKLSKPQAAKRDASYAADVQVVSYDLLHNLSVDAHDVVLLDEMHAVGQPLSKQSKVMRAYFKANPNVAALGLTATLIPTEVRQVWHPIDLFWPGFYGQPQKTGAESWKFLDRFTNRIVSEYGTAHKGARLENLTELRALLSDKVHSVMEKDYARFLPPLNAEVWYLDEALGPVEVAQSWMESMPPETTHAAVICYKRDTAQALYTNLETDREVYLVDGSMVPEKRQAVLDQVRSRPRALLIATSESVKEAVSLSFAKQALILEWRTSPGVAEQLLGRFPRPDSQDLAPTYVQYAAMPGDESRAEQLTERIAAVREVMATGQKSEVLERIFQPRAETEDSIEQDWLEMLRGRRTDPAEWKESEDDD